MTSVSPFRRYGIELVLTRLSGVVWETMYFEDGIDNVNHPGNLSKKYRSVSFLDPECRD